MKRCRPARNTAELRVQQFLPSHLRFSQIGKRIFLSGNTVKTQAVAIYRKLGTSSRNEAVERARRLGQLEGPARLTRRPHPIRMMRSRSRGARMSAIPSEFVAP